MRPCKRCNKDFESKSTGRPREICYTCKPLGVKRGGQTNDKPVKTGTIAVDHNATVCLPSGVHCGYCGSYLPPGRDFCNTTHEQLAVKPVVPVTVMRSRRPLERAREQQAA